MDRKIRFFISTRGRIDSLEGCIASLSKASANAFPDASATCCVFDDSTVNDLSAQVRIVCKKHSNDHFRVQIIDRTAQSQLLQAFSALHSDFRGLLDSSCKMLANRQWDLAGVRNFAFIVAYGISNANDLIIFLDDDILFESAVYCGHFVPIDGAEAIKQLEETTAPGTVGVSSVSYFGRVDPPIDEHIGLVARDLVRALLAARNDNAWAEQFRINLNEIGFFPTSLPARLNLPNTDPIESGSGIGGTVVATTPASLFSHGLPRCYNEQRIWESTLGATSEVTRRIRFPLLHAAPPQLPITTSSLFYQNRGDIVYRAVKSVLENAPSDFPRIAWCGETLSAEHFAVAKQNVLDRVHATIRSAVEAGRFLEWEGVIQVAASQQLAESKRAIEHMAYYLQDSINFIEAQDPKTLYQWFLDYLGSRPMWQELLMEAKAVLRTFNMGWMESENDPGESSSDHWC